MDYVLLAVASILIIPLFLASAVLVWISVGRPILFIQDRGGFQNRVFKLYKFRTMTDHRDREGNLLPDAQRITRIGALLRATSLDELPSMLNLVRGDIRLVGPRPFIAQYLPLYSLEQRRRHEVLPGVTGWAQVNGRNALTWEEKFALDVWYVENRSFRLDVRILWMTLRKVLAQDGISASGDTTMPVFEGSK